MRKKHVAIFLTVLIISLSFALQPVNADFTDTAVSLVAPIALAGIPATGLAAAAPGAMASPSPNTYHADSATIPKLHSGCLDYSIGTSDNMLGERVYRCVRTTSSEDNHVEYQIGYCESNYLTVAVPGVLGGVGCALIPGCAEALVAAGVASETAPMSAAAATVISAGSLGVAGGTLVDVLATLGGQVAGYVNPLPTWSDPRTLGSLFGTKQEISTSSFEECVVWCKGGSYKGKDGSSYNIDKSRCAEPTLTIEKSGDLIKASLDERARIRTKSFTFASTVDNDNNDRYDRSQAKGIIEIDSYGGLQNTDFAATLIDGTKLKGTAEIRSTGTGVAITASIDPASPKAYDTVRIQVSAGISPANAIIEIVFTDPNGDEGHSDCLSNTCTIDYVVVRPGTYKYKITVKQNSIIVGTKEGSFTVQEKTACVQAPTKSGLYYKCDECTKGLCVEPSFSVKRREECNLPNIFCESQAGGYCAKSKSDCLSGYTPAVGNPEQRKVTVVLLSKQVTQEDSKFKLTLKVKAALESKDAFDLGVRLINVNADASDTTLTPDCTTENNGALMLCTFTGTFDASPPDNLQISFKPTLDVPDEYLKQ